MTNDINFLQINLIDFLRGYLENAIVVLTATILFYGFVSNGT